MGLNSFGVEIPPACSKEELVGLLQIAWQKNRDPNKEPQGWKKLVSFYRKLTSGDSSDSDSEWSGDDEDRSSTPLDVDQEDNAVPLDGPLADQLSCVSLSKAPDPEINRTGWNCVDSPEITEFDTAPEISIRESVDVNSKLNSKATKRKTGASGSTQNAVEPAKKVRRTTARQSSIMSFTKKDANSVVRSARKHHFQALPSRRSPSPSPPKQPVDESICAKCGWHSNFTGFQTGRPSLLEEHKIRHQRLAWKRESGLVRHKLACGKVFAVNVRSFESDIKPLLSFMDDIFGEYVGKGPRGVYCVVRKAWNGDGMEVIGMLAWQPFKKAYLGAIQEDDKIWQLAGQELFDVKVVIDRLWVSPCMRRKGIATFLLNNFISPEMKVKKSEICLTDPTDDGAKFAIKYFNRRVLIAR